MGSFYVGGSYREKFGVGIYSALYSNLNSEISSINDAMASSDMALAALRGTTYASVVIESVASDCFHLGHKPSLLAASKAKLPNVSVMVYQSSPDGNDGDTYDTFDVQGYVELFVKGELNEEELINNRCQRTTDAVINIIARYSDCDGQFFSVQQPPLAVIGNVMKKSASSSSSTDYLVQPSRIEFNITGYNERVSNG